MTTIPDTLKQRPPFAGKDLMAKRHKRQSGTGSIVEEENGLAIRWPEYVIAETGERKRKMRYAFLGPVSRTEAGAALIERIAQARRDPPRPVSVPLTFKEHATRWQQHVLESAGDGSADLYKFSVRSVRTGILKSRLIPRFGNLHLPEITIELIQEWIAELRHEGLAAATIHSYHKALKVTLQAAVTWKKLTDNPAEGVELPRLKGKTKKWALMPKEAGALLKQIQPLKVRAMIALAIVAGLRRGELLAARWKALDEANSEIAVTEASYRGHIDTPKTEAGERKVALDQWILGLLKEWKRLSKHTKPEDFIFATRTGKQESPGNILRRYVSPACEALKLRRATWNTFRRTFSTWLHHQAIPGKTIADMMGHADVETQFIYIQSEDPMKRVAAEKIGDELSRYVVQDDQMSLRFVN